MDFNVNPCTGIILGIIDLRLNQGDISQRAIGLGIYV